MTLTARVRPSMFDINLMNIESATQSMVMRGKNIDARRDVLRLISQPRIEEELAAFIASQLREVPS
jgi:hypothetical protein